MLKIIHLPVKGHSFKNQREAQFLPTPKSLVGMELNIWVLIN